jgi:hypothetical protein
MQDHSENPAPHKVFDRFGQDANSTAMKRAEDHLFWSDGCESLGARQPS